MMNGTLINYYFHCKRQCYLHGNKLNLEDNSELVNIGKALHEEKNTGKCHELAIENIKIDKLSDKYLTEIKKSDADKEAVKWQVYYYLYVLKQKGIDRIGKIEYLEKNKPSQIEYLELNEQIENQLKDIEVKINVLLESEQVPAPIEQKHCKKCAYFEYCYL